MGTRPVLLICVDCAGRVFRLSGYCARYNFCLEIMAISYIANKEDRASKNASYAQSFKIPSEYNVIRNHLTKFLRIHCYLVVIHITVIKVHVTLSVNNVRFH